MTPLQTAAVEAVGRPRGGRFLFGLAHAPTWVLVAVLVAVVVVVVALSRRGR